MGHRDSRSPSWHIAGNSPIFFLKKTGSDEFRYELKLPPVVSQGVQPRRIFSGQIRTHKGDDLAASDLLE